MFEDPFEKTYFFGYIINNTNKLANSLKCIQLLLEFLHGLELIEFLHV